MIIKGQNMVSAIFNYKLTQYFLSSLESIEIGFQDGGHGGHLVFPMGTIPAIFIYSLPRYFLASFELIGLSVQETKRKLIFKMAWRPPWISDRNDFSYFLSIICPNTSYQVSRQLAFQFRRRSSKIDF